MTTETGIQMMTERKTGAPDKARSNSSQNKKLLGDNMLKPATHASTGSNISKMSGVMMIRNTST